jgi:hypothetical protein
MINDKITGWQFDWQNSWQNGGWKNGGMTSRKAERE